MVCMTTPTYGYIQPHISSSSEFITINKLAGSLEVWSKCT